MVESTTTAIPYEESVPPHREVRKPFRIVMRYEDDPRLQRLSDSWWRQGGETPAPIRDAIGRSYIKNVLGLSGIQLYAFEAEQRETREEAKELLIDFRTPNEADISHETFWRETAAHFPETYYVEDLAWLIEEGGKEKIDDFLFRTFADSAQEPSRVLNQLISLVPQLDL